MTHVHDLPLTIPSGDEVDCETCKSLLWLIRQHIAETPPTYTEPERRDCGCECHRVLGIRHVRPCCGAPPMRDPDEDRSKPRPATQAVHAAFNHGDSLHAHYDEVTGEALKGEPAGFDAHLSAEEAADLSPEDLATLSLEPQDVDPDDLRDTAELPAYEPDLRDIDPQGPDNRRYGYPWAQTGSGAGCSS